MALFDSHPAIRSMFADARMEERRRFDIANPSRSGETRAIPELYWHSRSETAVLGD